MPFPKEIKICNVCKKCRTKVIKESAILYKNAMVDIMNLPSCDHRAPRKSCRYTPVNGDLCRGA